MNATTLAYWLTTGLAALLFAIPGAALVLGVPHFMRDMSHLGYPGYFATLLGGAKVLGALAIVVPGYPRLKEWAYAGLTFDVLGALVSRAIAGDNAVALIVPSAIGVLVAVSWTTRPNDRMLASERRQPDI